MKKVLLAMAVAVLGLSVNAWAQLHGMGRVQGSVSDEGGAPLEGVTVKATLAGSTGSIDGASNAKGEWAIGGMGKGEWDVTFEKAGFAPRKAKINLTVELARIPPIPVTMKKS
jgi:hypothetical protein